MLKDLIKEATIKELREARDYIDGLINKSENANTTWERMWNTITYVWNVDMDEKVIRSAMWEKCRRERIKDEPWYCRATDWFKYNLPDPYRSLALSYEVNNLFRPTSMSSAVQWLLDTKEWKDFWEEVGRCHDQWLQLPEIPWNAKRQDNPLLDINRWDSVFVSDESKEDAIDKRIVYSFYGYDERYWYLCVDHNNIFKGFKFVVKENAERQEWSHELKKWDKVWVSNTSVDDAIKNKKEMVFIREAVLWWYLCEDLSGNTWAPYKYVVPVTE